MEQWQSDQINDLVGAIVQAQLKMVPASKDHINPYFKSKYADLPSCWEAVSCFRDAGIAITQSPMDGPDGFIILDTQLSHTSGQWMRSRLKIRVAKDDPQGYGSAITYARRYALGCMTGLVTEEDDDGNAASNPQGQRTQAVANNKREAQRKLEEMKQEMHAPGGPPTTGPAEAGGQEPSGSHPPADPSDVMARAAEARRTLATLDVDARAVNEWYRQCAADIKPVVYDDYRHALKQAGKKP